MVFKKPFKHIEYFCETTKNILVPLILILTNFF